MGYVGNQTTTAFTSMAKQDITGDGGTGYTLDHAVANAQEIEVFVNNVRQEPGYSLHRVRHDADDDRQCCQH